MDQCLSITCAVIIARRRVVLELQDKVSLDGTIICELTVEMHARVGSVWFWYLKWMPAYLRFMYRVKV